MSATDRKVTPGSAVGRRTGFEQWRPKPKLESTAEEREAFWARHGGQRFWETPADKPKAEPRRRELPKPQHPRVASGPGPAPAPAQAARPEPVRPEPTTSGRAPALEAGDLADRIRRMLDRHNG